MRRMEHPDTLGQSRASTGEEQADSLEPRQDPTAPNHRRRSLVDVITLLGAVTTLLVAVTALLNLFIHR
jgi:hypothetical protein